MVGRQAPRAGLIGSWDRFVGPGASAAENAGSLGLGLAGALLAPRLSRTSTGAPGHRLATRLLALDLWGGAWCNNTLACVRWYHRPGQQSRDRLRFVAAHVHPLVLGGLEGHDRSRAPGWLFGAAHYGYLLAATLFVERRHGRARTTAALRAAAGGVVLDRVLGPSGAAPWFAPVFYVKLLVGHVGGGLADSR